MESDGLKLHEVRRHVHKDFIKLNRERRYAAKEEQTRISQPAQSQRQVQREPVSASIQANKFFAQLQTVRLPSLNFPTTPSTRPRELINFGNTLQEQPHHLRVLSSGDVTQSTESPRARGRVFSESDLLKQTHVIVENQSKKIDYAKEKLEHLKQMANDINTYKAKNRI